MNDSETILCSNCKRDIPIANADLHLSHCVKHLKLCELCDDAIPIREFQEHLEEEHRELECSKCKAKFQQGEEDVHQRTCTHVKLKCEYCELEFPRCDLLEHLHFCGTRTDPCEMCNERVMLKDMLLHVCNERKPVISHLDRPPKTRSSQASTSPYALQPLNNGAFAHLNNFQAAGEGPGIDYLDELISTDHLLNGSAVDLDAALAAQLAHDERRQEENIPKQSFSQPEQGIGVQPRSKGRDDMLPCEFCETMIPFEDLILHQSGCLDNLPGRTTIPSSAQIPYMDPYESFIPCEFCCKQFPLSVIAQHQEGCTPTRRVPSYSQIVDERPIRPATNMPTWTPPTTHPARTTQPARTTTQPGRAARPTNSKRRTPAYTPSAGNNREASNSQNVSEAPATSFNPPKPIHTRLLANPIRGVRKEPVPKPKMTLGGPGGKEPLRVKNSRGSKTSMNDLDKASSACPVPTVIVPKRKQLATNGRGKQQSNDTTTELPANNNNNNNNSPWSSPKIINRNVSRDNRATNGKAAGARGAQNGARGTQNDNHLNSLSSSKEKANTGKNIKLDVPDSTRNRQSVLSKYQRDKTFVVSKNNED